MSKRNEPLEPVLMASYMRDFSCIGGQCEDSCCTAGWDIYINRSMYKKYKKAVHPDLKDLFENKVKRIKTNPSDAVYAKFELCSDGSCPFLTEDGLCKIQKYLGEEYLSVVCCNFPRVLTQVNGTIEKSAVLSCPEAARKILLNPNGIEFDRIEERLGTCYLNLPPINTSDSEKPAIEFFWELRIFSIQLMQNRKYPVSDRLIILGMFFLDIQECIDNKHAEDIPKIIQEFNTSITNGELDEPLSEIPVLSEIQVEFLKLLLETIVRLKTKSYSECLDYVMEGINYRAGITQEEVSNNYRVIYDNYYLPFMSKHEYILENYLVNYIFSNLFPCGQFESTYQEYLILVVHYALIKFHLIGMAGYHKEISFEIVIKAFQYFSASFDHNKLNLSRTLVLLQDLGYTKMSDMMILIKN